MIAAEQVQLSREFGLDLRALGRYRMGFAHLGFPILQGSVDCILVPPKFAAQRCIPAAYLDQR